MNEFEGKVPDKLFMTQAEYAQHRGVVKSRITKLKKEERLVFKDGLVDVVASDRKLSETGDPSQPMNNNSVAPAMAAQNVNVSGSDYQDSKAKIARFKARQEELDLAEREGRMFSIEDIKAALEELGLTHLQKMKAAASADASNIFKEAQTLDLTEFTKFLSRWVGDLATRTSTEIEGLINGEQAGASKEDPV